MSHMSRKSIRAAVSRSFLLGHPGVRNAIKGSVTRCLELHAITTYRACRLLRRTPSLAAIANYHASDKGTLHGYGDWPWRGHNYAPVYERLFARLRSQPVRLLEVGIGIDGVDAVGSTVFGRNQGGASLKVWHEFFEDGHIYGMDISPAGFLDRDRIRTFVGDQGSREDLENVVEQIGGPLDIIIDDGSHASRHQQVTLAALFPHLRPGGIYIVEDIGFQPPSIEAAGDSKTVEVLRRFQANGDIHSPFMSGEEMEYLKAHIESCEFASEAAGTPDLAILKKRRSS